MYSLLVHVHICPKVLRWTDSYLAISLNLVGFDTLKNSLACISGQVLYL